MIFLLQHLNWSAILRFFPTFFIVFATLYIPAWLLCYVDRRYFGGKKLKPKARYCMFIASIEMGIMISLAFLDTDSSCLRFCLQHCSNLDEQEKIYQR